MADKNNDSSVNKLIAEAEKQAANRIEARQLTIELNKKLCDLTPILHKLNNNPIISNDITGLLILSEAINTITNSLTYIGKLITHLRRV